ISVGSQELFVIGTDDQVYFHKLDSAGNPVGNYVPLPGPVKMQAISAGPGYPWLFALGVDHQVYMQRFNAHGDPVGGYVLSRDSVGRVVLLPNPVKAIAKGYYANPGLFVVGADDQVYVHKFDYDGNPVGNYVPIPLPPPVKVLSRGWVGGPPIPGPPTISVTGAIAAGSLDSGTALLSVLGTDSQVYLH